MESGNGRGFVGAEGLLLGLRSADCRGCDFVGKEEERRASREELGEAGRWAASREGEMGLAVPFQSR